MFNNLAPVFVQPDIPYMTQHKKATGFFTVPDDLLKARIYTLDNGLKIYLTVYKDAPRIQTYIAVRAGSKMDPRSTTGLAHYFEHMMFKGTRTFGTLDWEKEKKYIESIETLFEIYRNEKDEAIRRQIYKEIDRLSNEASRFAIPNEYDKLMDVLGSQGSNAGTSNDYTIYMENIPSDQVENWAMIEAERFSRPVLRLFHTELETVYEEKNMSLTNDSRKVHESTLASLFPDHPYGNQTTLGETEHLRNPSMKNIREFFSKYYVPNNMAICMSGDLDPEKVVTIIGKYFGKMVPVEVQPLKYNPWKSPDHPVTKEITGLEAENIRIAFGFDIKADNVQSDLLNLTGTILSNGKAGLLDLNLNQKQKLLNASAYAHQMADYAMIILTGKPKSGQSLENVKELLLSQVEKLKKGDFPGWMLEAAVNNTKFDLFKQYETNQGRAMALANTFLFDIPYSQYVESMRKMEKVTKKELTGFINRYFNQNYVIVFKKQGTPEQIAKIEKPPITPIYINRDEESAFMKMIRSVKASTIQPVFLDYKKDLKTIDLTNDIKVLYKKNTEDDTFTFCLYYKMGKSHDRVMNFALSYLPFLGTSKHTAAEIRQEFYRLACNFSTNSTDEETYITLNGLTENIAKALSLLEELLTDPRPDAGALKKLIANTLKARQDSKSNQQEIFNALVSYGIYGPASPVKHILSEAELANLTAGDLVEKIRELQMIRHTILYYGTASPERLKEMLSTHHRVADAVREVPAAYNFSELPTKQNQVLFVHYDAKQTKIQTIIKEGKFDAALTPTVALYNNYFGGNIVFQELREKRALAYTAYARFQEPSDLSKSYLAIGYIATQNDKMMEALAAFNELYNKMPLAEITLSVSKNSVLGRISSERITKMNILWNFINSRKLGLDYDIRKEIYENVKRMSMRDMKEFNRKFFKDKTKTYLVLGKETETDFKGLEQLGPVTRLTLRDIFGY
jgi:predicted Zn-dependent peptidase